MLATRIGQGVAGALVIPPGLALAGDRASGRDAGSKLYSLTMSSGLDSALGPLLARFLVRFGFLTPFALGAGLALVALVVVDAQVPEPDRSPSPTERDAPGSDVTVPSD
jgi:MFS family permease